MNQNEAQRLSSVAKSTLANRKCQWMCYERFCNKFSLRSVPCSNAQAALYATHLSQYMVASSISNYIHAIIFFHNINGHTPPDWRDFNLKATISGIKNTQEATSNRKDPLLPKHLAKIAPHVEESSQIQRLVWAAMCFLFRTLLRVSHVVASPHTLKSGDIILTDWGFWVKVISSKTRKKSQKPQFIPVVASPGSAICPVPLLKNFLCAHRSREDPLFSTPSIPRLTYGVFHKTMDYLTSKASLPGDFASHSLRRGGASFMSMIDCTVPQIKSRGNWSSECVYEYIVPSLAHELSVDSKFSSCYSKF